MLVSLMEAQPPPPNFSPRRVPPTTLQDLTTPVAAEMQLSHHQSQAVIEGLEELVSGHQQPPAQLIETGLGFAATEIVESSGSGALVDASEELQKQVPNSLVPNTIFTTVSVTESNTPSTYETPSYKEIINGLPSLWEGQKRTIESLTDDFWKNQEFPLARIKKIMRIDDDVKMISTEVPVMFSKILEIFITELTMRSWLHTEESKRRTVQRSDIALAITKHDMFDFLIDIVPREEIQFKTKTQKDGGEGMQVVPPDTMQGYIQQLINQTLTYMASGSGGDEGEAEASAGANTVQQLQLLQQLMQLQQTQQEQLEQQQQQEQEQSNLLEQMDPVPESSTLASHELHHRHCPEASGLGGGVDIRVLQSSSNTATPTSPLTRLTSSMGSTLKQIAKNGGQCQINSTEVQQGTQHVLYDQHSLHHMGCQEDFDYPQQQQQEIFTSGQHSQITTVIIPQPLDSLVQQSQPQTVSSSVDSLSAATFHLQHQTQHDIVQESLSSQLESVATEQFIGQQLPVELTSKYGTSRGRDGDVGGKEM